VFVSENSKHFKKLPQKLPQSEKMLVTAAPEFAQNRLHLSVLNPGLGSQLCDLRSPHLVRIKKIYALSESSRFG